MTAEENNGAAAAAAEEQRESRFQTAAALLIALFAAVLALNDLASAKFEGDQMMASNEQASAYAWYQSKSTKQGMVEGQLDMLTVLRDSGMIDPAKGAELNEVLSKLEGKVDRYDKEKDEILNGSSAVGQENWAQDIKGELGKVIGAEQYKQYAYGMDAAGNVFDLANLFLQLCLVLGAICLLFHQAGPRHAFFWGMNVCGGTGLVFAVLALLAALKVAREVPI
jgi:hypothetical protein